MDTVRTSHRIPRVLAVVIAISLASCTTMRTYTAHELNQHHGLLKRGDEVEVHYKEREETDQAIVKRADFDMLYTEERHIPLDEISEVRVIKGKQDESMREVGGAFLFFMFLPLILLMFPLFVMIE